MEYNNNFYYKLIKYYSNIFSKYINELKNNNINLEKIIFDTEIDLSNTDDNDENLKSIFDIDILKKFDSILTEFKQIVII